MNPQPKKTRWKSKKYRDGAKDQPCTMSLPCCNNNPETTVLAHRNGSGMALKADDHDAADMCSVCHATFDGVLKTKLWWGDRSYLDSEFESARLETIINRIERGILKV